MKKYFLAGIITFFFIPMVKAQEAGENTLLMVKTANGTLEGLRESGISSFKGIPFAAPPVGQFRWREPQPVQNWKGVRKAGKFGPRAMQRPIFGDMAFRSDGMSEDCLYLNVWTPSRSGKERLPVLVYFYGGGMMAGDGSELRYDGESMSRKGIVAVTVNYRLNVFGFFAHPELTKESAHHASGNYGLLDQAAALQWVHQNIAAFGGDPSRVTIAGESAGSFSVSAQMASPLSKQLIAGAIGESGSLLGKESAVPLAQAEQNGVKFAALAKAASLAELRKMPAEQVLELSANHEWELFKITVDGYFFPKSPLQVFAAGGQSLVPLLVGWNAEEMTYKALLGKDEPTKENFAKAVQKLYGSKAAEVLQLYNAATDADVQQVATDLAGDRFIGYGTWKWADIHSQTGHRPVYRYLYTRPRGKEGAVHSAEIEYAMGNLSSNKSYVWEPEDYKVSAIMQDYFANFIKTGNPNGLGVPLWKPIKANEAALVMHIDVNTSAVLEKNRERYLWLDKQ
ncbi:carboxylesterase/lipase family protein [Flavihumibacter profundi]|uniref:carboxylesterase/lipase family protein n=1 Tax=Flavihumibacter profundi TaxID=2716883 RepID=UPI001CC3D7E4|nr:carboxylesterase family protein [Flavihumibacter profundi]MBZ5856803.1 carboxylesterase family protein [Flavihumibacter profundi]